MFFLIEEREMLRKRKRIKRGNWEKRRRRSIYVSVYTLKQRGGKKRKVDRYDRFYGLVRW